MTANQKIEVNKEEQKTYTPEEFAKAYQELCDKMGYRVNVNPAFVARDDGSWSTVLQFSVGLLPKVIKQKIDN